VLYNLADTVHLSGVKLAIFISYSHQDSDFVSALAVRLAKQNTHVWIDTWEINVGDSLIDKVQNAIQDAGALLVVLSKASVESEWCKKELNAGLVRELEEKRVVVLPLLKEDCIIPIFLREKKYADFRSDFNKGFHELLAAVAKVTNPEQGRIRSNNTITDWAETWGYRKNAFYLDYDLIESTAESSFNILTQITVVCNGAATRRYEQYQERGLDWLGRLIIAEQLALLAEERMQLLLKDARPQNLKLVLRDRRSDRAYRVTVRCRRMGEDNGKDQLVTVSKLFPSDSWICPLGNAKNDRRGESVGCRTSRPRQEERIGNVLFGLGHTVSFFNSSERVFSASATSSASSCRAATQPSQESPSHSAHSSVQS
jgi:TIR domain